MKKAAFTTDIDVNANNRPAPEGQEKAPAAAGCLFEWTGAIIAARTDELAELFGRRLLSGYKWHRVGDRELTSDGIDGQNGGAILTLSSSS